MKQLTSASAQVIIKKLESELFALQMNVSIIDQTEASYTEYGSYTPEAYQNLKATNRAVDALNMAINNLKDIK